MTYPLTGEIKKVIEMQKYSLPNMADDTILRWNWRMFGCCLDIVSWNIPYFRLDLTKNNCTGKIIINKGYLFFFFKSLLSVTKELTDILLWQSSFAGHRVRNCWHHLINIISGNYVYIHVGNCSHGLPQKRCLSLLPWIFDP